MLQTTTRPKARPDRPDVYVRCRAGCCLIPARTLDGGEDCPGCGGSGSLWTGSLGVDAVCGACHGYGVLGRRPRWMIARYGA